MGHPLSVAALPATLYTVLKVGLTAAVVVAVAEIGRRSTFWGAALASLPLTSLLAFVWMHLDGAPDADVARLSVGIFWLVLASLPLFLAFPALLRHGLPFWAALGIAVAMTAALYLAAGALFARFASRG